MTVDQQVPLASGLTAASSAEEVMVGVDLNGKTAVVTGGYSGLGLETVHALAKAGARVLVPARRPALAHSRLDGLERVTVFPMDLADLASVRAFCGWVRESEPRLDVAILAAGVMASPERRVGPGWESQLAINHFGHFVLTNLLLPVLSNADGARVVSYSSAGHHLSDIRWDDMHFASGYDKWLAYGQSKTANVLFAAHLDAIAQDDGIRAFSLHPGAIITELQRDMTAEEQIRRGWIDEAGNVVGRGFKTPSQGAATGLWAATSPLLDGRGGVYCEDCDVAPLASPGGSMEEGGVRDYAVDPGNAERLWQISARITGLTSHAS